MEGTKLLCIAVFKGGVSSEREISLQSGAAVAQALRDAGHQVYEIDLTERALPQDLPQNLDLAFPVLHGEFGEDGELQALLEAEGISYVGCDSKSSAVCISKTRTVDTLRKADLPVAHSIKLQHGDAPGDFPMPCVVKADCQGSTIGVYLVKEQNELQNALNSAFEQDETVLLEEFIEGIEFTVAVLFGEALPLVEVIPPEGFFDFEAKYTYSKDKTQYNCPPKHIPLAIQQLAQAQASQAYTALHGRDLMRLDFIWQAPERLVILEANTMPGFTAVSLMPKAAAAAGITFTHLCCKLVENCTQRVIKAWSRLTLDI